MSLFEPVVLTWKGVDYEVKSDNVMMMLAQVEDILTMGELIRHAQKGGAPVVKISMAYATMLRYAGAKVLDDEVYVALMQGKESNIKELTTKILQMMMPPTDMPEEKQGNNSEK